MSTNKAAKQIINTPASEELSRSYLEYSMSVVYSRALPSISDGLKPVQRRILYAMLQDGFLPSVDYVKSARPVAATMGRFHPHGDSSIYGTLVKMAQDFYMNLPLVDGYGNFGDITGSGAAAARYTEARLSKEALLLLNEVRENTVDMRPNYDGQEEEPINLPTMFPNLLINGNFGIGVGFAHNSAPHNPSEAMEAAKYLLKNPNASLEQLMKYIPGPDFPTGAEIIGLDGIKEAYETGGGKFRLRSKVEVKSIGRGKHHLIFTELPYEISTENIIKKIKDAIKVGKLSGLADAQDLTDRKNGLRVVVETKAGINPQALLNELYKETQLENTFSINNTVLVDGKPKVVGLKEILESFIKHRREVITRRSQFRKDKRETRLHLVEGLLKGLANIDEVIRIIRAADNAATAQQNLMKKFKIDEIQADHILSISLRRLTKYDQIELDDEKKKLLEELAELNSILSDPEVLKALMLKEFEATKKQIARPRKTTLLDGSLAEHLEAAKEVAQSVSLEIPDEQLWVGVHVDGSISRSTKETGVNGKKVPLMSIAPARTRGKIVLITSLGKAYRVDANVLKETGFTKGNQIGSLAKNERFIGVVPAGEEQQTAGVGVFLATKNGNIKIAQPQWPVRSDEFDVIGLAKDDELIAAVWAGTDLKNSEIVLLSTDSSLLKFPAEKVRPQGLSGAGVAGIKLAEGAHVIAANYLASDEIETAAVVTFTGQSFKQTPYKLYPAKGRATGGVRSHRFLKGEDILTVAAVTSNPIAFNGATKVDLPAVDNRRDGSGAKATSPVTVIASA